MKKEEHSQGLTLPGQKSALDKIMETGVGKKRALQIDFWLQPGTVVKITTKTLEIPQQKEHKMVECGDRLKLDQTHLETVIPAPGERILVKNH